MSNSDLTKSVAPAPSLQESILTQENFDLKLQISNLESALKELQSDVKEIIAVVRGLNIPSNVSLWWVYTNRKELIQAIKTIIRIVRA